MASTTHRPDLFTAHTSRVFRRSLLYIVLGLGGFIMFFPFIWMALTSFKSYAEAIATPPSVFPSNWGLRLNVLGHLLGGHPLVILIFVVWAALGVWVAWRFRSWPARLGYLVVHLALFVLLGNLSLWGANRLSALWQASVAASGISLDPFFDNYVKAWARAPFAIYFRTSIIMSVSTPLLIILTTVPAAYAFARLRFPGKDLIFMAYLATMMIPSEVLLIPNFITITSLGWKNTYAALIVPFAVSVVTIFFLRQFFLSIPNDLFDAATIDGCGHVRFMLSIALPLEIGRAHV
jgi:ABC-type glycerol-3-phosphate transport system permease component